MEKLCDLRAATGTIEECPRSWCAFWERGGAVIEAGCAIDRMGVDLCNRDLAYYLLDLRRALETVRDREGAETFPLVRPPGL